MKYDMKKIRTLGQLKAAGYKSKSIKEEMRDNLIDALKKKLNPFTGIKGFEDSVIPQLQTAILAKHNIILLGLRGQAKTRIARMMTHLLDEYMPVVAFSELNDDPLKPLSRFAIDAIDESGDSTPIQWIHRSERYTEKLATPDVSVSDLIGDVDPIKAASLKLTYADERVIHYGLIPRSHRGIFVINELPDLQARIQVALFNMLQEGDIQIRGFKLRLPLDIQFVFTANPEDYTNRGSIVTPLKDRIDSQILTHYPKTVTVSKEITAQEANISAHQRKHVHIDDLLSILIEEIAFQARQSEFVDQKSGVSARMTISAMENLFSYAERRMFINGEKDTFARISDLYAVIPSITGKVELVYEGELEGIANVAYFLIGKAIRSEFTHLFPNPEKLKKDKKKVNIYAPIIAWFGEGNKIDILNEMTHEAYEQTLLSIPGLKALVEKQVPDASAEQQLLLMEFVLNGLAEFSQLSKTKLDHEMQFKDLVGSMFDINDRTDDDDDEDGDDAGFGFSNN
ncbi:MAG: sigma 54-interacting transcriptional regulator [Cytophaga sp.]|uniref:sigma 54-interacting transcriptional regulator n=1 Tax=Cytophaga sp. TaxID=29535 RepID=UPI003F7E4CA8